MSIAENIKEINNSIPSSVRLIAVSKFHPNEDIIEAYNAGQRIFGESKAQELTKKHEELPKDIEWHFIGHLQTNKIKYIAPFIHLIHSVDSARLLRNINKEAKKVNRVIPCLLQVHIAEEDTKYGFTFNECKALLASKEWQKYTNIQIVGLMGMATNTDNQKEINEEFKSLSHFFDEVKETYFPNDELFKELSIGMSDDYEIAIENGSTLIRVGSKIFGQRVY